MMAACTVSLERCKTDEANDCCEAGGVESYGCGGACRGYWWWCRFAWVHASAGGEDGGAIDGV